MSRQRAAVERAMRRRAGAPPEQARKIKMNLLGQSDLFTTCQGCGKQRFGSLEDLMKPCEGCGYGAKG